MLCFMDIRALRPLFILGVPKSGTTLIQRLLDGHPALVVDDAESKFFSRFVPRAQQLSDPRDRRRLAQEIMFRKFSEGESTRHRRWDYPALLRAFDRNLDLLGTEIPHYLPSAVCAIGNVTGQVGVTSRYWVEKTPYWRTPRRSVHQYFPDAMIIQTIRDPRANFSSVLRMGLLECADVGWFAHSWAREARRARRAHDGFFGEAQLLVRYEDIAQHPARTVERIAKHLDLPVVDELFHPTFHMTPGARATQWAGNSAYGTTFEGISATSVARWREELAEADIKTIEAVAGAEMNRAGYGLETGARRSEAIDATVQYGRRETRRALQHVSAALKRRVVHLFAENAVR